MILLLNFLFLLLDNVDAKQSCDSALQDCRSCSAPLLDIDRDCPIVGYDCTYSTSGLDYLITDPSLPEEDCTRRLVHILTVGSCEYRNLNFDSADGCIDWYKCNGLILEVFFETLTVTTYTQAATYPLYALISDISGHAGLWLGASVMSIVELLGLVLMCVIYAVRGRRMRVEDRRPAQDDTETGE